MTRIATTAENNLTLFYMQQNQGQLKTLSTQISTGIQSETYAGIAPHCGRGRNAGTGPSQRGHASPCGPIHGGKEN